MSILATPRGGRGTSAGADALLEPELLGTAAEGEPTAATAASAAAATAATTTAGAKIGCESQGWSTCRVSSWRSLANFR